MLKTSRALTAATLITSTVFWTGLISPYTLLYNSDLLFTFPPQLWRLVTPFFITDKKLNVFLGTYMIWQYSSELEKNSARFRTSADFLTYILLVSCLILVRTRSLSVFCLLFLLSMVPSKNLVNLLAQPPMAEAVPEREEDHPCCPCCLSFAKFIKKAVRDCEHGGRALT